MRADFQHLRRWRVRWPEAAGRFFVYEDRLADGVTSAMNSCFMLFRHIRPPAEPVSDCVGQRRGRVDGGGKGCPRPRPGKQPLLPSTLAEGRAVMLCCGRADA